MLLSGMAGGTMALCVSDNYDVYFVLYIYTCMGFFMLISICEEKVFEC